MNLLEREADPEGRAFWIGELQNGNVSRAEFMLALINGAVGPDGSADHRKTLSDKGQIGYGYAVENGLTNVGNAAQAMEAYDLDDREGSLAKAQVLIDTFRLSAETEGRSE